MLRSPLLAGQLQAAALDTELSEENLVCSSPDPAGSGEPGVRPAAAHLTRQATAGEVGSSLTVRLKYLCRNVCMAQTGAFLAPPGTPATIAQ